MSLHVPAVNVVLCRSHWILCNMKGMHLRTVVGGGGGGGGVLPLLLIGLLYQSVWQMESVLEHWWFSDGSPHSVLGQVIPVGEDTGLECLWKTCQRASLDTEALYQSDHVFCGGNLTMQSESECRFPLQIICTF